MRVEVVPPGELGPREQEIWRGFQRSSLAQRNPFLSPEFTRIVGDIRPRTRVGVLSDAGDIVGFFPFERGPLGRGLPVAPGLTDAQGVIHAEGFAWSVTELLRGCRLADWEFDHLVSDQKPFEPYLKHRARSPVMDLADGFAPYLATLRRRSASFVRDLEKAHARLERQVGEVRTVLDEHDVGALRVVTDWKSAQYQRTGRSDRFAHPWIVDLVERLLEAGGPRFAGLLSMLYAGGEPVAGHFGLRANGVLAAWFPAYDRRFRKYGPGLLQHLAMARDGAADGITAIDMGRGAKEYKDKLATDETVVFEGRVVRRVPSAAVHWARVVPARTLRNTVMANPTLYRGADRVLHSYARSLARVRTAISPKEMS